MFCIGGHNLDINQINNRDVHYAIGGMAQYYDSLLECISYRITPNIKKIVINTSVQPNSSPHFGTITTLFCAFVFSKMIRDAYNIKTLVEIDFVDCCPSASYHKNGGEQCFSISNISFSESEKISIAEYYIGNFYIPLLNWVKEASGIDFSIRRYKEFQEQKAVREALISICNDHVFFENLLSPKTKKLHIRTECPFCGRMDKMLKNTRIIEINEKTLKISSYCEVHGNYTVKIKKDNHSYFEINTQLRDIVKGILMNDYMRNNVLGIMLDGGDWGGTWTHSVHCIALQRLKCPIPLRLFSPLILDWSGGKLSKSIYRTENIAFESPIEDYPSFISKFGEKGLEHIYLEVENWLSEPKKFFRNYSLEYILEVLKNCN